MNARKAILKAAQIQPVIAKVGRLQGSLAARFRVGTLRQEPQRTVSK